MNYNPLNLIDFYKSSHRKQYPEGTTLIYSNFTPRKSRVDGVDNVVFFGLQYAIKEYLINQWDTNFFQKPKNEVVAEYKRRMETSLGEGVMTYEHIEALHDLGYLPIKIKALPEGTVVPMGIPVFTIINTKPEFYWIVNYLETLLSALIWKPCTSATTAYEFKKDFVKYAELTGVNVDVVEFQGHDFSMRGMGGIEDAIISGAGHLLSFKGTDTVPSIDFLEKYYNADSTKELVGASVPATEHSVMSMNTKSNEIGTFKRLINEIHPKGIVSIVSDTWDFWAVLNEYLPQLKSDILGRDGKVVIRPDSGDPVKIICGNPESSEEHIRKGAIEVLWEVFGGTINEKGYKELDPHIGLIYGDSITRDRQKRILKGLKDKGFASSNIVLGVGSYTYVFTTRDVYGFAMKATYGEVNGVGRNIFKDPKTDDGTKKSAKGLLQVSYDDNNQLKLKEECTWEEESKGLLTTVFEDGSLIKDYTLQEIRNTLKNN